MELEQCHSFLMKARVDLHNVFGSIEYCTCLFLVWRIDINASPRVNVKVYCDHVPLFIVDLWVKWFRQELVRSITRETICIIFLLVMMYYCGIPYWCNTVCFLKSFGTSQLIHITVNIRMMHCLVTVIIVVYTFPLINRSRKYFGCLLLY